MALILILSILLAIPAFIIAIIALVRTSKIQKDLIKYEVKQKIKNEN